MAVIKCKICGGTLDITDEKTVCKCEYCGSINKITEDESPRQVIKENIKTESGSQNIESLLKRAFMFLEDEEWDSADEYCEKVLDIDPECGEAYVAKLLAKLEVTNKESLPELEEDFSESKNFEKAVRFGCDYLEELNDRSIYNKAVTHMKNARNEAEYLRASNIFKCVAGYKDADEKSEECREAAHKYLYDEAERHLKYAKSEADFRAAAAEFRNLGDYKDSEQRKNSCVQKAVEVANEDKYNAALDAFNENSLNSLQTALKAFEELGNYKNSAENAECCRKKIDKINNSLDNPITSIWLKILVPTIVIFTIIFILVNVIRL